MGEKGERKGNIGILIVETTKNNWGNLSNLENESQLYLQMTELAVYY